jgi:hypothetical protein
MSEQEGRPLPSPEMRSPAVWEDDRANSQQGIFNTQNLTPSVTKTQGKDRLIGVLGVDWRPMNAPAKPSSPVAVTDPKIRRLLQFAGLRFGCSRAQWLDSEFTALGIALKTGKITSDQLDEKLTEMGALDLVYPELMGERK